MRLTPALEYEKLRQEPDSWNKIFLHKDGKFFRAYVVSASKQWLMSLVPHIRKFLADSLGLELHMGKLSVTDSQYGTEFLGAYVKPYRTYASNDSLRRMMRNIRSMGTADKEKVYRSVNSFLGVLSHHRTYRIRRQMFLREKFLKVATFDNDISKMNKPVLTDNHSNYEQGIWN